MILMEQRMLIKCAADIKLGKAVKRTGKKDYNPNSSWQTGEKTWKTGGMEDSPEENNTIEN